MAIITADCQVRGGKQLPLKAIVDEAIALGGCGSVKHVLVVNRAGANIAMQAGHGRGHQDVGQQDPADLLEDGPAQDQKQTPARGPITHDHGQSAPSRSAVQRKRSSHIWRISASCGVRNELGNSMVTTGTFLCTPP